MEQPPILPTYFTPLVVKYAKSGEPSDREAAVSNLALTTAMNRQQSATFCDHVRAMFITVGATNQEPFRG